MIFSNIFCRIIENKGFVRHLAHTFFINYREDDCANDEHAIWSRVNFSFEVSVNFNVYQARTSNALSCNVPKLHVRLSIELNIDLCW